MASAEVATHEISGGVMSAALASWNPNASEFVPGGLKGSEDVSHGDAAWPSVGADFYGDVAWGYTDDGVATTDYDESYMQESFMDTSYLDDAYLHGMGVGVDDTNEYDPMTALDDSYHTTPDLNPSNAFDTNIGFQHLNLTEEDGGAGGGVRPGNYKTLMCRHFEKGYCTRGASCNFAHGEQDLRKGNGGTGLNLHNQQDDPRCVVLTMCGAWGALVSGPSSEPSIPSVRKGQFLEYLACQADEAIPPELKTLRCVDSLENGRRGKP